jgi:putative ubiquitin-RnfH superfamily antitoxin RatB of RatAB toxin-antitoxin module
VDATPREREVRRGVRAMPDQRLADGDRVEVLRGLQADPKEARRRRAAGRKA